MKNKKKNIKKGIFKNVLLLFVTILVFLILFEIVLRLFYPQNLNYTIISETRVFEHKPGIETLLRRQEFTTHVAINSKGLRDQDYNYDKNNDTFRIAVLGDSFAFGYGVEQNESYSEILEKMLNKDLNGKNFEVINFGTSAYGTEQELIYLQDEISKYNPDVVLLGFSVITDIKENVKHNLFEIEDNVLKRKPGKKVPLSLKIRNLISWNSHAYSLLYFSLIEKEAIGNTLINLGVINPPDGKKLTIDFNVQTYLKEPDEEFEDALEKTKLLLLGMRQILSKRGIDFVIILIPTKEQVDDGKLHEFLEANKLNEEDIETNKIQNIMIEFSKRNNIKVIDLLPEFKALNQNNTFYYDIDGHWNKKGHELAAELILENFWDNKLLSS